MRHFIWPLSAVGSLLMLSSCMGKDRVNSAKEGFGKEHTVINVNPREEFYDSVFDALPDPKLIVLQENDSIIFAEISKIISKENRFFILDQYGSRTAVSFNADGTPLAKYGCIGQGPGEYVRPWDMDIIDSCVYILDSNLKKVIRYDINGKFLSEKPIPFIADAFTVLHNKNIVFNLYPDGEGGPQLCLTDSNINVIESFLPSEKGYIGGWGTDNVFRKFNDRISFYRAPLDTIMVFDKDMTPMSSLTFDFGARSIPDEAKLDFIAVSEDNKLEGTWMLVDSPIPLAGGLLAGIIHENRKQYTFIANPENNRIGMKSSDSRKSVLDIMEPCASDEEGNLISYTSLEFIEDLEDFDSLDETVKKGLQDTNRLLIIYPFAKLNSQSPKN